MRTGEDKSNAGTEMAESLVDAMPAELKELFQKLNCFRDRWQKADQGDRYAVL